MRPAHRVEFKGALTTATNPWSTFDAHSVSLGNGASWFARCWGFTFMLCPRPLSSTCPWVGQSAHQHRRPHTTAQSVLSCTCGSSSLMCRAKDGLLVRHHTTTQTSRQTRGCDLDHVRSPARVSTQEEPSQDQTRRCTLKIDTNQQRRKFTRLQRAPSNKCQKAALHKTEHGLRHTNNI